MITHAHSISNLQILIGMTWLHDDILLTWLSHLIDCNALWWSALHTISHKQAVPKTVIQLCLMRIHTARAWVALTVSGNCAWVTKP